MKILDNRRYSLESLNISQSFIQKIANKNLDDFEKEKLFIFPTTLNESIDLTGNQKIIESNSDYIRSTNVMGIIGYQEEQLFIGSRFDDEKNYFLFYMLKRVLNFNLFDSDVNVKAHTNYFDLLILIFPKYLNEALRKGLYKEYKVFKHNDANLKGKIDIKRNLKENIVFTGKLAYNTREQTVENQVNYLIRYTVEHIRRRKIFSEILNYETKTKENIKVLESNTVKYREAGIFDVINYNKQKPVHHGYFHEYRKLQQLCLAILAEEQSIYSKEKNNQIKGILFDGAWLFEEYINLLIKDMFYHPENKGGKGAHFLFNNGTGKIFPDFISKEERDITIADAKYKPIGNINGDDYLQLVAYMYRFDSNKGYYLFPYGGGDIGNNSMQTLSLLQGVNKKVSRREKEQDIKVTKLGLKIPEGCSSNVEFEEKIHEAEQEFVKRLLEN